MTAHFLHVQEMVTKFKKLQVEAKQNQETFITQGILVDASCVNIILFFSEYHCIKQTLISSTIIGTI